MVNEVSFKTAKKRKDLSSPTRYLDSEGLLKGRVLDYGCGYGYDASFFNFEKYDPYFFPILPEGEFDVIMCNYVLNVVFEDEQELILKRLSSFLIFGGNAYITVRRDKDFKEGFNKMGTYQRNVFLDLPILYEKKNRYCIYHLNK